MQVSGTCNPSWKPVALAAGPEGSSWDYASGLLHVHVYCTACHKQQTGPGSALHGAHAAQPQHPVPQADHADPAAAATAAAGLEAKPSFKASMWRSLTRADSASQQQQQQQQQADGQVEDAVGPATAAGCCTAVPISGHLVAAGSFDLSAVPQAADSWATLAELDPAYPQPTLLLELPSGIYSLPALDEAAAQAAKSTQPTAAASSPSAAAEEASATSSAISCSCYAHACACTADHDYDNALPGPASDQRLSSITKRIGRAGRPGEHVQGTQVALSSQPWQGRRAPCSFQAILSLHGSCLAGHSCIHG